jgi:hypothetical protein
MVLVIDATFLQSIKDMVPIYMLMQEEEKLKNCHII